jgi:hypothetical protein
MIKPKYFMNALVKVRDTHETVTLGRYTFTYLPASHERAMGQARCEYAFRRPILGDLCQPEEGSVSIGGFAWASTSIVRMGRVFAHSNDEMDRKHAEHQSIYLCEQIYQAEKCIEVAQADLNKRASKAQLIGLRCNLRRIERIRDDFIEQLDKIAFDQRKIGLDRLDVRRETDAQWRAA